MKYLVILFAIVAIVAALPEERERRGILPALAPAWAPAVAYAPAPAIIAAPTKTIISAPRIVAVAPAPAPVLALKAW